MIRSNIKMENKVKTATVTSPSKRNTNLITLYPRKTPTTVRIVAPEVCTSPETAAKPNSSNPDFMMIPSRGSCFFMFFTSCTIFMTFFLIFCVIVVSVVVVKGFTGAGFRSVKVFSKNTTRRAGDFLKNRLRLDLYCPLRTRKHLCPRTTDRCDDRIDKF